MGWLLVPLWLVTGLSSSLRVLCTMMYVINPETLLF